jgi:type IV secretory pathway VirB2 component (pilin)
MRKEKTLFIIGIWVMILPFLGFRNSWRQILFLLTGLAIIYLAYQFYLEVKNRLSKDAGHSKTFVDNIGSGE